MRSSSFFLAAFLLFSSTANPWLTAQDELERFIERDSTAFIVIEDPEAVLQQIESSVFLKNRHLQRALELMVDGKFPLANQERLIELKKNWSEIRELLGEFDEVSVIIHSWAEDYGAVPKISVAFAGSEESVEIMEGLLKDAKSSILKKEPEGPDFFSLVAGSQLDDVSIEQVGELILLSNAPEKSKQLVDRLEQSADKKFRSLARNRSYLMVQKLLEKRANSPQVRGFLAPKSFRRLITTLVAGDGVIMIEPPKSIASAGFQILLQNESETVETSDGTYQPVVNWDFVLTYTRPSSGFGKLIESFEPFEEFPSFPFSVTSLSALGFDLKAKHGADKEIFEKYQKHLFAPASEDGKSSGMDFEKFFCFSQFGWARMADPNMESLLKSTNGTISVYHEGNSIHWKPAMEVRKVNNREAMEQLVAYKLKSDSRGLPKSEKLVEIPNEHGRLFARTDSGIREHLRRRAKARRDGGEEVPKDFDPDEGEALSEQVMSEQYEYFVNDDWMLHCDHNSMKQFLRAAYEEPSDSETFDLLLKATQESSGQSSFFKIDYQSNNFYKVENKRIFNSIESVRILKKYGSDGNDVSRECWNKLMSEPDEDGLRIKIESSEDATAAVQQLIANAFNDSFGTVVSLYSKGDYKMRIFGQVYSLIDEKEKK